MLLTRRLLTLVALTSTLARADFDFTFFSGARSYPLGLAAAGIAGYGVPVWGNPGKGQVMYGYLRPVVKLQSSGTVQNTEARIDLYPISFAGISLGVNPTYRLANFVSIDCSALKCKGLLNRSYARANLMLGLSGFFLGGSAKITQVKVPDSTLGFYDEQSSISAQSGGSDTLKSGEVFTGYSWGQGNAAGFYLTSDRYDGSENNNTALSAYYQLRTDKIQVVIGSGTFRSSLQDLGFTAYVTFRYFVLPSIEL
jgi:hypothetical protein